MKASARCAAVGFIGIALLSCSSAPPPEPVTHRGPALATILDSIVQIKVKVGERMEAGELLESFEYGTGFFVNERGRILTSAHVITMVDDPRQITVFHRGRPLQARLGKKDEKSDLATLTVDAGATTPLPLAKRKPRLGELVYAIGFPYVDVFRDSTPGVSTGHLAGVNREINFGDQAVGGLLMTDAFVADGCSGGPLVGEDGQVLGVLRFNLAKRGSWLGLSFAEPVTSFDNR